MPKLSVIIPVYNVSKEIERCACCLFEQTLDDIEYIFIDDYSPDDSIDILKRSIKKYPTRQNQVRIIRMDCNSGQAAVRKRGTEEATGDYIIHCDGDDWTDKDMYKKLVDKAVQENADVVICGFARSKEDRIISYQDMSFVNICHNKELLLASLFEGKDLSSLCTKIVKRSLFIDNNFVFPTQNMWEDFVYSFQIYYYSHKTCAINEFLYYYYQNEKSICGNVSPDNITNRFFQLKENVRIIEALTVKLGISNKYKQQIFALKFKAKSELIPIVKVNGYRILWKDSFKEINRQILISPIISFRQKIKYILILLKIFP